MKKTNDLINFEAYGFDMSFVLQKESSGLQIKSEYEKKEKELIINLYAVNETSNDILVDKLEPVSKIETVSSHQETIVYTSCRDMLGFTGPQDGENNLTSYGIIGVSDKKGENAFLCYFDDLSDYFYKFSYEKTKQGSSISPIVPFENTKVKANEKKEFGKLHIIFGNSLYNLLKKAAKNMSVVMNVNDRLSKRPSGFCSWYTHYGTETWDDIKKMLKEYQNSPVKDDLEYFLIDGGWNENHGDEKNNWGDWEAKDKFPNGMKAVCDVIHEHGFKAGLWIAPFAVTKNSKLFKEHPNWVVGKGEDLMNNGGEAYGLDLTMPEVIEYIRKEITKVFDKWGYDYIKIDFLLYGALAGKREDQTKTSAMAFREGLKVIKECAKGRLVLNCGSPLFQSIGLCHAIRTGVDVGSRWYFPLNEGVWQYGNCNIKAGMRYMIYTYWMNGDLWQNDPDCLVARDKSNGIEYRQFLKFFPGMEIDESKFGLSRNEFLAWAKLIWITNGFFFLSDEWNNIPKERREVIKKFAEPLNRQIRYVDNYENPDMAVFVSKDEPYIIGVFNISDESLDASIKSSEINKESWEFDEITENISFNGTKDIIKLPKIPPRTGYVFTEKRR